MITAIYLFEDLVLLIIFAFKLSLIEYLNVFYELYILTLTFNMNSVFVTPVKCSLSIFFKLDNLCAQFVLNKVTFQINDDDGLLYN